MDVDAIEHLLEAIRVLQDENSQLRITLERARIIHVELMRYRKHNTLNFQLEKADDYLQRLGDILDAGGE